MNDKSQITFQREAGRTVCSKGGLSDIGYSAGGPKKPRTGFPANRTICKWHRLLVLLVKISYNIGTMTSRIKNFRFMCLILCSGLNQSPAWSSPNEGHGCFFSCWNLIQKLVSFQHQKVQVAPTLRVPPYEALYVRDITFNESGGYKGLTLTLPVSMKMESALMDLVNDPKMATLEEVSFIKGDLSYPGVINELKKLRGLKRLKIKLIPFGKDLRSKKRDGEIWRDDEGSLHLVLDEEEKAKIKEIAVFFESLTELESLEIINAYISSESMKILAPALVKMKKLKKLNLWGNYLNQEGGYALVCSLTQLNSLEEVHLKNNYLGSNAVYKLFKELIKIDSIKKIDLLQNTSSLYLDDNSPEAIEKIILETGDWKILEQDYGILAERRPFTF